MLVLIHTYEVAGFEGAADFRAGDGKLRDVQPDCANLKFRSWCQESQSSPERVRFSPIEPTTIGWPSRWSA